MTQVSTTRAEAEKYVPPLAPRRLPPADLLPKRITAEEAKSLFPMPLEIKGYCPVTFLDGKLRYCICLEQLMNSLPDSVPLQILSQIFKCGFVLPIQKNVCNEVLRLYCILKISSFIN